MVSVNSKESNEKRCQFWERHLKTWSKSGLTQNAYCRDNNLKVYIALGIRLSI